MSVVAEAADRELACVPLAARALDDVLDAQRLAVQAPRRLERRRNRAAAAEAPAAYTRRAARRRARHRRRSPRESAWPTRCPPALRAKSIVRQLPPGCRCADALGSALDDGDRRRRGARRGERRDQRDIARSQAQAARRASATVARRDLPAPTVATSRGAGAVAASSSEASSRPVARLAELRGAAVVARRLDHQHGLPREVRDERVPPVRAPHGRDREKPRRIAGAHVPHLVREHERAVRFPSAGRRARSSAAALRTTAATALLLDDAESRPRRPRARAAAERANRRPAGCGRAKRAGSAAARRNRGRTARGRRGTQPRRRSRAPRRRRSSRPRAAARALRRRRAIRRAELRSATTTAARCESRPTARPRRRGPPWRSRTAREAACAAAARDSTPRGRSGRAPSAASRRARSLLGPLGFGDELAQVLELFAAQLLVLEQLREQAAASRRRTAGAGTL